MGHRRVRKKKREGSVGGKETLAEVVEGEQMKKRRFSEGGEGSRVRAGSGRGRWRRGGGWC